MNSIKKQELPSIGAPLHGGFYAGLVCIAGAISALIVAPKAQGQHAGVRWGEYGKTIPATSCYDGKTNTAAMAESESPAAKWATSLDINGHTDWYIPSRDELEIAYRNLKPTTQENYCSFRDGDNASSVPVSYPYTEQSPEQTTASAFRDGEAEAFDAGWYWSSTQCSAGSAYVQGFDGGYQDVTHKANEYRVRAVRRLSVIE